MFFLIFILLIGAIHYWLWARLVRDMVLPPGWQRVLAVLFGLLAASIPLTFLLSRRLDPTTSRPLLLVLYVWLGVMFWLTMMVGASELVRLGAWLLERRQWQEDPAFAAERRTFLARALGGATLLVTTGFTLSAARSALRRVQVKRVEVPLKRLPPELDGFRIVQLSDVHVGPTIGERFIREVVSTVNELSADVVVITGDLVDGSVERLGRVVSPLAEMTSHHGTFFVTGNHEYYSGAAAWCEELTRMGIRVLRNEHVTLRGASGGALDLAGVDDIQGSQVPGHGADLPAALRDRDPKRPVVLLAHQPVQVHEASRMGVDLQLSGHTHGGQLWPWHFFVRLQQPVVAGLAWFRDTAIYVSSGTGYWGPPLRLGAPAEVTEVVLKAA